MLSLISRYVFHLIVVIGTVLVTTTVVAQTAPSTTVFGPKIYFHNSSVRTETFTRTESQLQQSYRLIVKNADGGLHSQRNCSGLGFLQKLLCQAENAAQQIYVNNIRASSVTVSLNGQALITQNTFNRNIAQVELPLTAALSNELQIKVTGSTVSYIEITIQVSGEESSLDQTAPLLTHNSSGMQYISELPTSLNLSITTNEALQSLEVDGNVVFSNSYIYTFSKNITALEGNQIQVKAVDLAGNITETTYNLLVTLDDVAPVITLGSTPSYTNGTSILLPIQVQDTSPTVTKIFVADAEVAQVTQTQFSYLIELPEDGNYQILVRSIDAAGNSQEKNWNVIRSSAPLSLQIQTPASSAVYESTTLLVKFSTNHPLSAAFVNAVPVSIQPDGKSVEYLWTSPFDGPFQLEIKVVDIFSNEITQTVTSTIQLGGNALWSYTECPVE